jgi:histone-lysine N-methyltransferase SETD8
LNTVRLAGAAGRPKQHVLLNFHAIEKRMAKNVEKWKNQKDTSGEPEPETKKKKDNSVCQASNVEALQQGVKRKDTGGEPETNPSVCQASNVEALQQGVKRKLFCSCEREHPEDASLCNNSDTREKTVQTSDKKFVRQPSKKHKKNTSRTLKFGNVFFTLWEDLRPLGSCLFKIPRTGMALLEEKLVAGPKLGVKFEPIQWQDFVNFGDQGWITDDCIDYYLRMIAAAPTSLKVKYIQSTCYAASRENGYNEVNLQPSEPTQSNFLDSDLVFFPINIPGHWILGVVDVKKKLIYILDSMYNQEKESIYEKEFQEIKSFCINHFQDTTGLTFSDDYFKYVPQSSTGMVPPQQNNNVDCGMFVILACLFISHGLPLSYKQEEIRYWRNRAAIEVLFGCLFPFHEDDEIVEDDADELIDDSMDNPQYVSSSLPESDSKLDEFPKYVRPRRRVSSELKKMEAEELRLLLSTDERKLGLEVRKTSDGRGRGVFTETDRSRKSFICEYIGEIVSEDEANRRVVEYVRNGAIDFYQYYFKYKNKPMCIDAQEESGLMGRLLNHSKKKPNCWAKLKEIDNSPRIVIFALKDISKGAELMFDYGDRSKASILVHPWLAV